METFDIRISTSEARILLKLLDNINDMFYAFDERPSPALNNFTDRLMSLVNKIEGKV